MPMQSMQSCYAVHAGKSPVMLYFFMLTPPRILQYNPDLLHVHAHTSCHHQPHFIHRQIIGTCIRDDTAVLYEYTMLQFQLDGTGLTYQSLSQFHAGSVVVASRASKYYSCKLGGVVIGGAPVISSSLEAATRACNHQKSECTVDYESLNGGCTAELATGKQSNWELHCEKLNHC